MPPWPCSCSPSASPTIAPRSDAEDVAQLREHGYDDRAISSCVQVVAYFNYINRIAEGLGVGPEDWIDDDGREKTP